MKALAPTVGDTLAGRYLLAGKLGEGGMSIVYRAVDQAADGREVAVKLLTPRYVGRSEREQRLLDEATYLEELAEVGSVANILDHGRLEDRGGWPYLVVELLEGRELNWLLVDQKLDQAMVRDIAIQVARAMFACHKAGIVHRDLTPANLSVTLDPLTVVLFDFSHAARSDAPQVAPGGHGRLTGIHDVPGTSGYMSAEQAWASPAHPSMDVFAFGVLLYKLITRRDPFPRVEHTEFILMQRSGSGLEPPRLQAWVYGLGEAWSEIIHDCTQADARRRPSAAQLVRALENIDLEVAPTGEAQARTRQLDPLSLEIPIPSRPGASTPAPASALPEWRRSPDVTAVHPSPGPARAASPVPPSETDGPMLAFARPDAPRIDFVDPPTAIELQDSPTQLELQVPPPDADRSSRRVGFVSLLIVVLTLVGWGSWALLRTPSSERAERPGPRVGPSKSHAAGPAPHLSGDDAGREEPDFEVVESVSDLPRDRPPDFPRDRPRPKLRPVIDDGGQPSSTPEVAPEPADACVGVVVAAEQATQAHNWTKVVKLTTKRKCWPSQRARVRLRIEALVQSGRWTECVESAAPHLDDHQIASASKLCSKHT